MAWEGDSAEKPLCRQNMELILVWTKFILCYLSNMSLPENHCNRGKFVQYFLLLLRKLFHNCKPSVTNQKVEILCWDHGSQSSMGSDHWWHHMQTHTHQSAYLLNKTLIKTETRLSPCLHLPHYQRQWQTSNLWTYLFKDLFKVLCKVIVTLMRCVRLQLYQCRESS